MSVNSVTGELGFKLSICISTRNRAEFIGKTLDSILSQASPDYEIIVFDGASTDATEQVLASYSRKVSNIRYFRQEINDGAERGFDHAVQLASGEYCWLMPDDDLLKPGAVDAILAAISKNYSLIVVNAEYRDLNMAKILHASDLDIDADCEFGPEDIDRLFATCWKLIRYLGSVVIRREVWLSRDRERFFGSYWMHIGAIFQERLPGAALLIATPYVCVRMENQSWLSNSFQIFYVNWPALVSSLALSESVKQAYLREGWTAFQPLLLSRAAGQYSLSEYRNHVRPRLRSFWSRLLSALIAVLPRIILNTYLVLYYSTFGQTYARSHLLMLTQSRFNLRTWLKTSTVP